jgi:hypothetical protein
MADPDALPEIDFALVGRRAYVRATDILRELIQILPSQTIAICFRKPLRGPALLERGYDHDARSTVRAAGGVRFSLVPRRRKARRVTPRPRSFFAFCLRAGALYLAFTGPGSTIVDRIECCFDLGISRLPQRFFVRTLILHRTRATQWGIVWFRLRRSGSDARCVMRTFRGPLAEVRFFVRLRNRLD